MTLQQLQQGLRIFNDLRDKKERLQRLVEFSNTPTFDIQAAGITIPIPKQALNTKIQSKINELQAEIDDLQTQFDTL